MLFTEVMERLETEAKALKEGKGSRIDWRILTILYCIKVGNYENLLLLLLDLSRRLDRGGDFSRSLLTDLAADLHEYLVSLTEGEKEHLRESMGIVSSAIRSHDHWWWGHLRETLA